MRSAYNQWGLKHKTNEGTILSFSDWATLNKEFLSYGRKLQIWDNLFDDDFLLLNYDDSPDSVVSLIDLLPIHIKAPILSLYDLRRFEITPKNNLLAFYALFHNRNSAAALPSEMVNLLSRYPQLRKLHAPLPRAAEIFPDVESINRIMSEHLLGLDSALINRILDKKGQKVFSQAPSKKLYSSNTVDKSQLDYECLTSLLSMLLTLLVEQDKRIAALEEIYRNNDV